MTIAPEITDPADTIVATLAAHKVAAIHATTFAGPTVTQYALSLTAGTKLKSVQALDKDIALALGLPAVRIVAPIPGTSYVGVEVPTATRETVTYDDIQDGAETFDEYAGALPFPIGVDVTNTPVWADLAKLPHLLIAGQTGSGKSVAVTSLITSLIDHRLPDEVRLWLIDPKRVELAPFAGAPHVERVATDNLDIVDTLIDVVAIMDSRYRDFEAVGARNITEWNHRQYENPEDGTFLPYQVVVVDELADLIMTGGAAVEDLIVRIAQLGRAAGIHLVLATQRPTKNVVTGLIAANVPSRWAFAVRSTVDSMVALDQTGAQALYGSGDSLWLPAGADKAIRIQGVYTDAVTVATKVQDAQISGETYASTASPDAAEDNDDDLLLADLGVDLSDDEPSEAAATIDHYANWDAQGRYRPRVRDRSADWLNTTVNTPAAAPEPTVDEQWAAEVAPVSEESLVLQLEALQAENERLRNRRYVAPKNWWQRRSLTLRVAIVGVGGIVGIGWVGNIVEAIAS